MASSAEHEVHEEPTAGAQPARGGPVETAVASELGRLQRTAGNRATIAWMTRRVQRQPAAIAEPQSDDEAVKYAKGVASRAGRTVLREETRRLFRYVVKHHAPRQWETLGDKWTFDDYPFQDFTFASMPRQDGAGFLLGVGPAFVRRIAAGDIPAVVRELQNEVKRVRSPELSGPQPAVPGLGPAKKAEIEAKIKDRDPQGALDLLVKYKVQDGTVDPALLKDGAIDYDPDLTEHGISSMQGWDYITKRAEKTYVRIGPGAFSSVAYLYSVVMHEYRHVLQRQSLANQQTESRLRAAGSKSINEVEAYALELLNATESGIKDLPERVASVWASLVDEYGQLDTPEKRKARPLAERARARAQAMIRGSRETLAPLPTP